MEDLTKQQIVLLALLLSFVTSIGTGIITSALLKEAPERVTQTINKVVENTIENVLPTETTIKETETITQIIIDADDAVTSAIEKVEKSLVRVLNVAGEIKEFSAIGIVITEEGLVAVTQSGFVEGFKYVGAYPEGEFDLVQDTEKMADGIIFLKPKIPEDTEVNFNPITIQAKKPKLGQSVINIGGSTDTSIQTGRISKILYKEIEEDKIINGFETSLSSATLGSLIVDYSGSLLGYNSTTGTLVLNKQFMLGFGLKFSDPEVSLEGATESDEEGNSEV